MAQAIWNDEVIAESDDTVIVDGNHYFPRDSVKDACVSQSDHTSVCGWKGTASYLNVLAGGKTNENAAWYYPEPKEKAAEIAGHVAFWKGVKVEGEGRSSDASGTCSI